jgi:DNA-binding response OmpR family regulator
MIAKTKILAIGNDPELLGLLQEELNGNDYEVASTQDTGAGLRDELHEADPDFICLDIMMPKLDGIGVCLHLRQWTQVPIMMLSTWGAGEGKVRGLNLGSEGYLTESFGIAELKARINNTLRRDAAAMTDPLTNARTGGMF